MKQKTRENKKIENKQTKTANNKPMRFCEKNEV